MIAMCSAKPGPVLPKQKTNEKKGSFMKKYAKNPYLRKAERVNGRVAMIGFVSAMAEELVNGHPLVEQFVDNVPLVVITSALVTLGTAANPRDEGEGIRGFTPDIEELNGRLAMLGMASLLLSETTGNIVF